MKTKIQAHESYLSHSSFKDWVLTVIVLLCLSWTFIYVGISGYSISRVIAVVETNNREVQTHLDKVYKLSDMDSSLLPDAETDTVMVSCLSSGEKYYDTEDEVYLVNTGISFVWYLLKTLDYPMSIIITCIGALVAFMTMWGNKKLRVVEIVGICVTLLIFLLSLLMFL